MTPGSPSETRYFPGEFLSAADYAAEQAYQMSMQRAGAAALGGWGIMTGLAVSPAPVNGAVSVSPGLAMDSLGRLILLGAPRTVAASDIAGQILTIAYHEAAIMAEPGRVGMIAESATLAWLAPSEIKAPSLTLTLAVVASAGGGLSPDGRIYAGAPAGAVEFASPLTPSRAAIVGWSAEPLVGLRIDADRMSISGRLQAGQPAAPESSLSIQGGAFGVGTMSPQACLDVLAPNVALTGPGLLTSFDTVVRGSDSRLGQMLHVGDVLIVTDRGGEPRQARVVGVTSDTELVTDSPLNCANATFQFEQALVASIRNSQGLAALSVDRLANLGLGTSTPGARLEVGGGQVELPGNGSILGFDGPGLVATTDGGSRISFQTSPPAGNPTQLLFAQTGDIRWLPGRVATTPATPPVGMALTAQGNLGLGVLAPANRLEVIGAIQLTSGGLVFPDGAVQTTAQVSIPVGGIIDWWQGVASQSPPANYMICAGGVVNDPHSLLHGETVPNLDNLFVFGASDDSQAKTVTGADTHVHAYNTPPHTHPYPHTHDNPSGVTGEANDSNGTGTSSDNAAAEHYHAWSGTVGEASSETTDNNSDANTPANTQSASTLPPYVGLLKLIRIR